MEAGDKGSSYVDFDVSCAIIFLRCIWKYDGCVDSLYGVAAVIFS